MKTLAIIAVVLICSLIIGMQHLFNYWIRKDDGMLQTLGVAGIMLSAFILGDTIYHVIIIFSPLQ